MISCIVPLAGPDFNTEKHGIKPLVPIDGEPLIKKVLKSRTWYNSLLGEEAITFVLRDTEGTEKVISYLQEEFSGCHFVKLSGLSKGALLSALAGAALLNNYDQPVVVDLVDIIFQSELNPVEIFANNPFIGGIIPYFKSNNPQYSYLEMSGQWVKQTAEKKVISNAVSAGVYFFRDLPLFLEAAADSIRFDKLYSYNNTMFLCPAMNGIIRRNKLVKAVPVQDVVELSLLFHT
ncbi:hypothetical protein [Sporomusa acidovorans]|uniref:Uncharacterized protein n=1 Tax=Sporomusa acidovorans (strain ATCC 49682 / DSM 3132 / Mol) TaxID=1123286 RepID=A0ABZ3JAB2_SPOA4|nr:hypothetical protein [Sporomusa acidovorans]OZC15153.1 hypothetical protein SPACI_50650 [Sporomusa acidovorans DSM 3132]SDF43762.1 hypothetical protein SAMN04488499_104913 [Sporomusa acidovorans]